ncbi:unnamed protein product [Bemisia tabaci]|uniref:Transcription initiation factor IIF subunit alpha n=1 Tax=Bemisia tabaci TaxID=7038 RepID=A0A9P0CF29_BEMTA|nr:PREDICTED: general transcription factor IIF subunit 1 [Bemisia tabaci]CAH0772597.1 unnamed protein product [Bemisia tabaci]
MNSSPVAKSQTASPGPPAQEYSIIVPKNPNKQYHVMRYNSSFNVDFLKWTQVKMERENNQRQTNADEEMPKFGAGSEFGREAKEEARKKKFGYVSHKYRAEDQPWILKCGGKNGKKFKGVREGGVGENAAYYVFSHNNDGKIEACPIQEWYNFQPIQRYKALSVEEAEQEFGRRNKVINYFSLMLRKRLRNEEDGDLEEEEEKKKTGKSKKKEKDLKISEMDEWMDSDEDDSESDNEKSEDEEGNVAKKKKKKNDAKKKQAAKKKKKKGSDESAVEESDDGDEEGRELDYISDSSDSESDHEAKVDKEMKGVAEESALRKLLTSDEDESEEEEGSDKVKSEPEENPPSEDDANTPGSSLKKKKKKLKKKSSLNNASSSKKLDGTVKEEESSSDFSPDSSDSELEAKSKLLIKETNSGSNSRSGSPSQLSPDSKRLSNEPLAKKPRLDNFASESGITEEAVRRYLSRKPMTATELLQKFKKPKNNLTSQQLVNCMTQILKRINPIKQTIKNKMYLSLKPS